MSLLLFLCISLTVFALAGIWRQNRKLDEKEDAIRSLQQEVEILKRQGSEFVANVSHELKTPLTSIKGYNETLKSIVFTDPDKAIYFSDKIDENSDRLSRLINDILQLSRIEQPNMLLDWETFEIEPLLAEIEDQFRFKIAKKNQVLVLRRHEYAKIMRADRRLVEQAITNLIENAHRYCPSDAIIEVEVSVANSQDYTRVRWAVSDNGPGIKTEDLPRIFERFFRSEKSRNRELGGTGLGLAIVKHIVLSHGGEVYAENLGTKGACFTLDFPQSHQEQLEDIPAELNTSLTIN